MEVFIDGIRYLPESQKSETPRQFHELIVSARELKQETIEEAARNIGTTKSNLWELENGRQVPRLPTVQKVLKYYGISFDEIAEY